MTVDFMAGDNCVQNRYSKQISCRKAVYPMKMVYPMKISTVEPVMAISVLQYFNTWINCTNSILQYYNTCFNYVSFI
jgi:hypothetical protein